MTARKIRRPGTVVVPSLAEDAFGTPPAARSGMMKVAGAEDDLDPGDELLTDDGEALGPTEGDPNVMKGPVYPEGIVRLSLGGLRRLIARVLSS